MSGKRVLIRSDLNVPLADGAVADASRIRAAAGTIREVMDRGGVPIILSHLGRPGGQREPGLSHTILAQPLSDALNGAHVTFAEDCIGQIASDAVAAAQDQGTVVLLENLRFHPGETANDPVFAVELAMLGDVFVNDAFSVSHRAHASVVGLAEQLPAVAGRLLETELKRLDEVFALPARPALALIGGIKVADKLTIIERLCQRFDWIAVAGGVANTLLCAAGHQIGRSVYQEDMLAVAQRIRTHVAEQGSQLLEPVDVLVASELVAGSPTRSLPVDQIDAQDLIVDLGPRSVEQILAHVDKAAVAAWAGPLGAADRGFNQATDDVARHIAARTQAGSLRSVAAGGETLEALQAAGCAEGFSYLSLGGGAFLSWLGGEKLPGLQALLESP